MKFSAKFLGITLSAILFSVFSLHTFAVSMTLQSSQSTLGPSDEYNVNATLSISASNGTNYYLRGAFYQSGTTNYCGYTWNGLSFYNGPYNNNGWVNLLPITIDNNSWSGTLKAKLDTSDAGCSNSGTYNFKIQRYTSSGTASFDSQNEQTITVVIPTNTPIPTPTSVPTSVPTNTPIPSSTPTPTSAPTNSPSSTPVPTVIKNTTIFPTTVITEISPTNQVTQAVLGENSKISPTPKISPVLIAGTRTVPWVGVVLVALGILIMGGCAILIFHPIEFEKLWPFKK